MTWRWYSSDPGSLRLVDGKYRFGYQDYFAFAEKPTMVQPRTFYADAMKEDLPNVAWIDPNFVDLGGLQGANDDHPPTDVMSGQSFVMRIYQALHESALWERSMLVIVYDEHGGFYDHVDPTVGFPESFTGRSEFRHFGPRVPAIVVSPFVEAGAAFGSEQDDDPSLLFDHTALIKTILLRFADDDCSDLPDRVGTSSHLGYVLTGDEARAGPEIPRDRIGQMTDWWARHIGFHLRHPHATVPALQELGVVQGPGGLEEGVIVAEGLVAKFVEWIRSGFGLKRKREAGRPEPSEVSPSVLTDTTELQLGIAAAAREIRAGGKLPPGRP